MHQSNLQNMATPIIDEVWVPNDKYWSVQTPDGKILQMSKFEEKYVSECFNDGQLTQIEQNHYMFKNQKMEWTRITKNAYQNLKYHQDNTKQILDFQIKQ